MPINRDDFRRLKKNRALDNNTAPGKLVFIRINSVKVTWAKAVVAPPVSRAWLEMGHGLERENQPSDGERLRPPESLSVPVKSEGFTLHLRVPRFPAWPVSG